MANRSVELAVRVSADASDVAAEFDSVGDAARRMGDDVDSASRQASDSSSRLDSAADSADNLGSRSSQAAGGLGDLGGAIGGLPGPLGALGRGMEAVAPAVMGVTGAADLANLALSSNIVTTGKAKVAAVAHTVATKAQTIATKALNLAMKANPLGLVIVAIGLLIAGFVTLYRRSETFRNGVDTVRDKVAAAFGAMLKPIQGVIEKIQAVIGFIRDAITATKRAIGLGEDYGSTMGRILGNVADDLASIGQQIRDNNNAGGRGGASGGGVGAPRTINTPTATGDPVTVDARTFIEVDASSLYDTTALIGLLEELLRRRNIRLGDLVPGAKVVTT